MNDLEQILNQWDAAGMETAIAGAINLAQNAPTTLSQILAKYTGTPNGTKFLRDDGSWQNATTTNASALTSGTLPLARLSGITTTELSASAGIVSGQIAGVALDKLTAGTLGALALNFGGAGTADSAKTQVYADASAGNLFSNVPTGKYKQNQVAGAGLLSLGRASSTQSDTAWAVGAYAANGVVSATSTGIYAISTSMVSNVPSGSLYLLNFADTSKYRFTAALCEFDRLSLGGSIGSSADPQAGGLALTGLIQFQGSATGLASSVKTQIYADGNAGNLIINTPIAKSLQLLVAGYERMRVDENGVNLNSTGAALTTTATAGHPRIPSCAGAPTGVPSGIMAGTVPICIDSTNSKLYAYIGGAWKSVTLA